MCERVYVEIRSVEVLECEEWECVCVWEKCDKQKEEEEENRH
jgi:hypothetical protein